MSIPDINPSRILYVSADHVVARHACHNRPFTIGTWKEPDTSVRYFVSAEGYGCSKLYSSPTRAIQGMLAEHACTNIRISNQPMEE